MLILFLMILMYSKSTVTSVLFLSMAVTLINFVNLKNHMMILLLMLELFSLLTLFFWAVCLLKTGMSLNSIFILMVMMVAEATLALSLLVSISRAKAGELELSSVAL